MPASHSRWQEIDEKLEADDQARIVRRQVAQLDPQILHGVYRGSGHRAYDPVILLQMVLYLLLKGFGSPARWCEQANLNEAVQWLGYGYLVSNCLLRCKAIRFRGQGRAPTVLGLSNRDQFIWALSW
jgi:transposase